MDEYIAEWHSCFLKCSVRLDCLLECKLGLRGHKHTTYTQILITTHVRRLGFICVIFVCYQYNKHQTCVCLQLGCWVGGTRVVMGETFALTWPCSCVNVVPTLCTRDTIAWGCQCVRAMSYAGLMKSCRIHADAVRIKSPRDCWRENCRAPSQCEWYEGVNKLPDFCTGNCPAWLTSRQWLCHVDCWRFILIIHGLSLHEKNALLEYSSIVLAAVAQNWT